MGKNKKSRNQSTSSIQLSSSSKQKTNPISKRKMKKLNKKKKHKSQAKIQQLFDKLRNESEGSQDTSLETSSDITVIELTEDTMKSNRMITPVKSRTSLIVINDDDDLIVKPCTDPLTPRSDLHSSPMHCSTPIQKSTAVNSKTIIDNSVQIVNNNNVTRQINNDSYLTIDLTSETLNATGSKESPMNTVIDLVNNTDTRAVDENSINSSMSGDSQVTVLQNRRGKIGGKRIKKFVNGIAKLSSSERGKLLEVIAQNIINGTDSSSHISIKSHRNCATETAEDSYIKEVILGQAPSRNSIGSNIYNPQRDIKNKSGLRMVVIDGSNVAMEHTKGKIFSVNGLKICIDYFVRRGHIVKAFVPQFRCKAGMSSDPKMLDRLERQGLVVYTPSRVVKGRQITSYDDRYIVQCAAEFDGVVVSRDNYRDLLHENPRWRPVIENRLLQFTWVGDLIMFPQDPLGRNGPTLQEFLRHPTIVQHPTVL